jgi:putative inorganic carbon (hco3(-)) transporter
MAARLFLGEPRGGTRRRRFFMVSFDQLSQRYPLLRGNLLLVLLAGLGMTLALILIGQSWLAISVMLTVVLTLAILAWPDLATLVVVFVLFTNAAVIAVKFHNVPELVGASLPALLAFPLTSYLILRREKIIVNPVLLPIFLFLAVQVIGTLFSEYVGLALDNVQTFVLEGLGLFFLITNVVRTPEVLRRVTWTLLIAGALIGALSFYQQWTRTYDNNYWGFAQPSLAQFSTDPTSLTGSDTQWRLAGQIGEKNRYAQVMLMLVPLGFFRVFGERKVWLRVLAGVCTAFIGLGAALAFSRGAAVGFVMMLAIMVFLRYIKLYQIVVIFFGLYLLVAALPQYGQRLTSLQGVSAMFADTGEVDVAASDGATLSRLTEMGAAFYVFLDHPVLGVGPGLFPNYYQDYSELVGLRLQNEDRQAHNLYLSIAAETGLLGVGCFLYILFVTIRNLNRARKRWIVEHPEIANMATAYMLSIVTYLTTGLFLHFAFIRYFWLIMALAGAVMYISEQQEQVATAEREQQEQAAPRLVGGVAG